MNPQLYLWDCPGRPGAFRVDLSLSESVDPLAVLRAEARFESPLVATWAMGGRRALSVVPTTHSYLHLLASDVWRAFEEHANKQTGPFMKPVGSPK